MYIIIITIFLLHTRITEHTYYYTELYVSCGGGGGGGDCSAVTRTASFELGGAKITLGEFAHASHCACVCAYVMAMLCFRERRRNRTLAPHTILHMNDANMCALGTPWRRRCRCSQFHSVGHSGVENTTVFRDRNHTPRVRLCANECSLSRSIATSARNYGN